MKREMGDDMRKATIGLWLVAGLAGCGGSPFDAREADPVSVTVSLRNVVLVGTTAQASGTAVRNNGQTQAVTNGWRSDAPAVASVTDAGAVAGVANGQATIYVVVEGVQGSHVVRVAPNYDGRWMGMQRITSCTATGDFAGFCEDWGSFVGLLYPVGMTGRHPGDLAVSGEFTIEDVSFPTFTTQVAGDGGIRFSGTEVYEGVRGDATWEINAREHGRAAGTIREVYSAPGIVSGEITFVSTLVNFSQGAGGLAPGAPSRQRQAEIGRRIRTTLPR
jgi:hypothetical protein